jgi:hypothetical protein
MRREYTSKIDQSKGTDDVSIYYIFYVILLYYYIIIIYYL